MIIKLSEHKDLVYIEAPDEDIFYVTTEIFDEFFIKFNTESIKLGLVTEQEKYEYVKSKFKKVTILLH